MQTTYLEVHIAILRWLEVGRRRGPIAKFTTTGPTDLGIEYPAPRHDRMTKGEKIHA